MPNPYILLSSFLALAGILGMWAWLNIGTETKQPVPLPPEDETVIVGALYKTPLEKAVLGAVERAAAGSRIADILRPDGRVILRARENAWVEIRDREGRVLLSRIMEPGDSYIVPDEAGIEMDTGNIGALEFIVDGAPVGSLGAINEVKRNISLNPAWLTEEAAKQAGE